MMSETHHKHGRQSAARPAQYGVKTFPAICGAMGGVTYVRYSARYAWFSLGTEQHRVLRSKLPKLEDWTAFNLADAVKGGE